MPKTVVCFFLEILLRTNCGFCRTQESSVAIQKKQKLIRTKTKKSCFGILTAKHKNKKIKP